MVTNVNHISTAAAQLPATDESREPVAQIEESCADVQSGIQKSIIAFQFYDRLSQRLNQVSDALAHLAGLVGDGARLYDPAQWSELQRLIRCRYTMAEEQQMFDAVLAGASMEEALDIMRQRMASGDIADIKLF